MKNRLTTICALALALLTLFTLETMGQDKTSGKKAAAPNQEQAKMQAYLGVGVESVPPALARQIPTLNGQGVLISEVAKDSPAQKAGLKTYDVLVSFDNHQLYSPEQLIKLVQNDKSGRQVSLGFVRAGKQEKVNVTLGEHARNEMAFDHQDMSNFPGNGNFWIIRPSQHDESSWNVFDSLTLSRLDDKTFKADISYRDEMGQVKRHSFKGTREQIRADMEKEKDLPAVERDHLMRALDMRAPGFELNFPGLNPFNRVIRDHENLDQRLFQELWRR